MVDQGFKVEKRDTGWYVFKNRPGLSIIFNDISQWITVVYI